MGTYSLQRSSSGKPPGQIWLSDYSGADAGVQLQAALNALMVTGGGELIIPAGTWNLATAVSADTGGNNDIGIVIRGEGSATRIMVNTVGSAPVAPSVQLVGFGNVIVENMLFMTPDITRQVDAFYVFRIQACKTAELRNTLWYGVGTNYGNWFVINTAAINVHNNYFGGCVCSQPTGGIIYGNAWLDCEIRDSIWLDYANLGGAFLSKTAFGSANWIMLQDPTTLASGGAASNSVNIRRCTFDEGSQHWIQCNSSNGIARFDTLVIEDIKGLVGVLSAIELQFVLRGMIRRAGFSKNVAGVGMNCHHMQGRLTMEDCTISHGGGGGTIAYNFDVDAADTSDSFVLVDCQYDSVQSSSESPKIFFSDSGIRSRYRRAGAAVVANTLVKPNAATAGRVDQLGAADAANLACGVALDAAGAAAAFVRVVEERGQIVSIKSDGAGGLSPGGNLTSSAASAGRVKAIGAGTKIGQAYSTAAAVADALVNMIWSGT